ncbi:hypothetical protein HN592_03470 [Candidatus Woesearchaeota archaeon]|jgi:hypothetical protein|nr:hypothetical protein [Candidatus Woesearchaeota archaeon]MBT4368271.1 hypothetical protein [Candidatus Woesearchaeota archaeon]MBT4712760.1 hypothetical protein [Candidatus Woesearchaeota archaeon]MBT6639672.1 hypothetical protein [Candidatus Woesearchaeota archaeon]MBT7133844.1 hypothetical protein [Candidatus Woesearchaeota archaeon]
MPYREIDLNHLRDTSNEEVVSFLQNGVGQLATGYIDGYVLAMGPTPDEYFQQAHFSEQPTQKTVVNKELALAAIECMGNETGAVYSLGKSLNHRGTAIIFEGQRRQAYANFRKVRTLEGREVGHLMFIQAEEFYLPNGTLDELALYDPIPILPEIDLEDMNPETDAERLLHQELRRLVDGRSGQYSLIHFGDAAIQANYSETILADFLTSQQSRRTALAETTINLMANFLGAVYEPTLEFDTAVKLTEGEESCEILARLGDLSHANMQQSGMILRRVGWSKPTPAEVEERRVAEEAEGWQTYKKSGLDALPLTEPDIRLPGEEEPVPSIPFPDEEDF